MERRSFLKTGVAAAVAAATLAATESARAAGEESFSLNTPIAQGGSAPFKLKYAPHFGMFRNHAGGDPLDELKFMHDAGFRAIEDNGMKGRAPDLQEKIGKELARLGMEMGVFVASAGFGNTGYASGEEATRERFLKDMKDSLEVAKRVNAKWVTVVPGERFHKIDFDFQTANVVDLLKRGAEICEPSGLVMVLEPLNFRDHPDMFLTRVPQAYLVCKAVGSPSCKILFDMYHQQITEGNIIPNIDAAWSEVAYFQQGDNPGRKEPTTGEMNYRNIFRHIHNKKFTGILGMEHGNAQPGKEGEIALIKAYRECDSFAV
ncbi:MAG TPA: TIM barrel protein [Armatimonadaceae bacterium]|nr:TIM barrel protein [Armatimonadaceae bacterium]